MRIIEFNMDCDSPESKNSSIFIALSGRVCQTLSTDRPSIDSFTTKKRERTIRRKKIGIENISFEVRVHLLDSISTQIFGLFAALY